MKVVGIIPGSEVQHRGPTEDSTMMLLHIVRAWFLRHDRA